MHPSNVLPFAIANYWVKNKWKKYKNLFKGSVELSPKFFDVPIYPVVGLHEAGNSIHLNFGQEEWDFDPRQIIPFIQ